MGLPGGASGKDLPANAGDVRTQFDSWVGKIPWRRAWQPTPAFLPGESRGQRSLGGYSPWGRKESDTTEHACTEALDFNSKLFDGDFPSGAKGKESTCQCKRHERHGFDPWVGKIPWSRKWQPAPVFLPGKHGGQSSLTVAADVCQCVCHAWTCRQDGGQGLCLFFSLKKKKVI